MRACAWALCMCVRVCFVTGLPTKNKRLLIYLNYPCSKMEISACNREFKQIDVIVGFHAVVQR